MVLVLVGVLYVVVGEETVEGVVVVLYGIGEENMEEGCVVDDEVECVMTRFGE